MVPSTSTPDETQTPRKVAKIPTPAPAPIPKTQTPTSTPIPISTSQQSEVLPSSLTVDPSHLMNLKLSFYWKVQFGNEYYVAICKHPFVKYGFFPYSFTNTLRVTEYVDPVEYDLENLIDTCSKLESLWRGAIRNDSSYETVLDLPKQFDPESQKVHKLERWFLLKFVSRKQQKPTYYVE